MTMEALGTRTATQIVERYLSRHASTDLEGVLSLFAPEATLEDPVGAPVIQGLSAIRAFYSAVHARNGRLEIERLGPILIGGREIAVHVHARLEKALEQPPTDVIYTIGVDCEGRIERLRAFFRDVS